MSMKQKLEAQDFIETSYDVKNYITSNSLDKDLHQKIFKIVKVLEIAHRQKLLTLTLEKYNDKIRRF